MSDHSIKPHHWYRVRFDLDSRYGLAGKMVLVRAIRPASSFDVARAVVSFGGSEDTHAIRCIDLLWGTF